MTDQPRALINKGASFWGISSIITVVMLGIIDTLTGYELSISLFYLAPISAASWFVGRGLGFVVSSASTLAWLIAEIANGRFYSTTFICVWNTLIRLGSFLIVTLLLDKLREAHQRERELARTDRTTGSANSLLFHERAQLEINRARRFGHPFALAYIDCDNFKVVNDRLGHARGDEALRVIYSSAQSQLRNTDLIARLGGDEFVLLLPETGETGARTVMSKVHADLTTQMQSHDWPVTFSIGVVTFVIPPPSVDAMILMADKLMYAVKNDTKNGVSYDLYAG